MTTDITHAATRANAFTDDALGTLDATGVAEAIAAGTLGVAEAAAAATERIRAVDPATRAVRWWLPEGGTGPQAPADAAFYGVPSAIKENTAFAGLPTTMGSTALPATPATRSGPVGEQFAATGMNVLASTVMPEFGMTASAEFADRVRHQARKIVEQAVLLGHGWSLRRRMRMSAPIWPRPPLASMHQRVHPRRLSGGSRR